MAADIHIITIEIVHKSTFALAGHAVPRERFAAFSGISTLQRRA
jgi:hypothetical protein